MINTLIGNIVGFLKKEFLFASFLPALLFTSAVAATGCGVLGVRAAIALIASLPAAGLAWVSGAATVALIAIAYVLSGLRGGMTRFWSGEGGLFYRLVFGGFVAAGETWQRYRFRKFRARAGSRRDWLRTLHSFEEAVNANWSAERPRPRGFERLLLGWHVLCIRMRISRDAIDRRLAAVVEHFARYNGEALQSEFEAIKRRLLDWDKEEDLRNKLAEAVRDRGYGSLAAVKATRLGNVIESYNYYAYKRYKIEAELLWPRLEYVVPEKFATRVAEARVVMDFFITLCTLTSIYAVAALLVGPWLLYRPTLWLIVAAVSAALARFFYLTGVDAARLYGERMRSCFDLFRLALLKQLGCVRPGSLEAERETWLQLSQLVTYGIPVNVPLAPE